MAEHWTEEQIVGAKENVVLLGPPGTGKTPLAIALGIRACWMTNSRDRNGCRQRATNAPR